MASDQFDLYLEPSLMSTSLKFVTCLIFIWLKYIFNWLSQRSLIFPCLFFFLFGFVVSRYFFVLFRFLDARCD